MYNVYPISTFLKLLKVLNCLNILRHEYGEWKCVFEVNILDLEILPLEP